MSTDNNGNLYFGGSAKAFSAGVVQYADGSEGVFLGAEYGLPGLSLGVSVSGTNSSGTNLSSYNTIQVSADGSYQTTSFVPGNGTGYPVQALVIKYDAVGNRVDTLDPIGVNNPYAHQMASGLAPHLYQNSTECFPADTSIQLASGGLVPIQSIRAGDQIAAFNGEHFHGRGGLDSKPVVRLFENITDTWIKLSWEDLGGEERSSLTTGATAPSVNFLTAPAEGPALAGSRERIKTLTVTPGHHFLDCNGGFRAIADILVDDSQIVLADGTIASVSGEYIHYCAETADLFEQAEGYQPVGAKHNKPVGARHNKPVGARQKHPNSITAPTAPANQNAHRENYPTPYKNDTAEWRGLAA